MSVDAFVSYATPDRAVTMALVEDLEARGLKCWVAPRDVPGGSKYAEVILNALSESKVFLLVFSENSNDSEHVQREVERALNSSKTIVPVRIADVFPSGAMDYYLATLHWIDAFGEAKEGSFEMVASAMAGVLGRELIDPDEAVGAGALPVPAGAGVGASATEASLPMPASASVSTATAEPDRGAASTKSGGGRGGMIAAGVAAVLAVGGLVAWKGIDWGGSDDSGGQSQTAPGDGGEGGEKSTGTGQIVGARKSATGNDSGTAKPVVDIKIPDKTTKSGVVAVAAAGNGADPKVGTGALPKNGTTSSGVGNHAGDKTVKAGATNGESSDQASGSGDGTEKTQPLVANTNVNLAGQNTDLIIAAGEPSVVASHGDVGTKMSVGPTQPDPTPIPKTPPPLPPDPVADAVAAAQKAWQSGERKLARESWLGLLQSPAGKDLNADKLGEGGVKLLSEMVVAAADSAEGKGAEGAAASAFVELDEWKGLVDFSEQLGLDELGAQRERFQIAWQVAQAESLWTAGSREEAARALTEIAALGAPIRERMKREGDVVGARLAGVLVEVTKAAASGRLGTSQVLTDKWRPSLQLAAERGDIAAIGVLATVAWKADDREQTAELLKQYELATRGADSLDAGIASLLGQAVTKAQAEMVAADAGSGDSSLLTAAWEPAFNMAYRHELPGSLEVVAEVTHRRDPGEAVALYRRLYEGATAGGSLRKRISFCLQMLARYDLGEESKFYRGELQDVCELTLAAMGQPATDAQLIQKIPEIRDAANAGVPAAQYIMADLTVNGKGVEKDESAAFTFYKQAADGGYARAKYSVGECLRDGRGTEKNLDEAERIWRSMKDDEVAEVPQALFSLALLLQDGAERTALFTDARKHYAVKVEDGEVLHHGGTLGFMLVEGLGGEAEPKRGYELLREAADQGSSSAAFRVGYILTGKEEQFVDIREAAGISLDEKTGTELMIRAAQSGYPNAVAWCEQNGVDFGK